MLIEKKIDNNKININISLSIKQLLQLIMTYRKNNKKKSPSYSQRKYQEMQYQKFQSENEFFLELEPEIEPQLEAEVEPISECSICMEQIINENDKVITRCNHHFHSRCLSRWTMQNDSCPNCRTSNAAVCYTQDPNLIIQPPYSPSSIIRHSPFYHILEQEITPSTDSSRSTNHVIDNIYNNELDNYIDNVYNNVNNIIYNDISSNFINNIITSSIDQLENLDTQLRHYEGIVGQMHQLTFSQIPS